MASDKSHLDMVRDFHRKFGSFEYPDGLPLTLQPEPSYSSIKQLRDDLEKVSAEFTKTQSMLAGHLPPTETYRGDTVPVTTRFLRARLILEEFVELLDAMVSGDVVLAADALADLEYVVHGTAVSLGIPSDRVFEEVHRSNMTKAPLDPDGKGGKVGKGSQFSPADVAGVLGL